MMTIIILISLIYIVCGILVYGINFSYCQNKFPLIAKESQREDRAFSILIALFGPFGLFMTFFLTGFAKYGWKI